MRRCQFYIRIVSNGPDGRVGLRIGRSVIVVVSLLLGGAVSGGEQVMPECLVCHVGGPALAVTTVVGLIGVRVIPQRLKSPVLLLFGRDVHGDEDDIVAGLESAVIGPVSGRIQQGAVTRGKRAQVGGV